MKYLGRSPNSDISLSQFLDIMAQDDGARDLDRHWREQRKEISYDLIPFDFIGDAAKLTDAMDYIIQTIFGVSADFQDTRISLGHKSASRHFRDCITRVDLANLEKAFAADFEMYEEVKNRFS